MKRTLGKAGIEVSAMGLGGWAIGGPFISVNDKGEERPMGWGQVDDVESIWTIHAAMDLGTQPAHNPHPWIQKCQASDRKRKSNGIWPAHPGTVPTGERNFRTSIRDSIRKL